MGGRRLPGEVQPVLLSTFETFGCLPLFCWTIQGFPVSQDSKLNLNFILVSSLLKST